MIRFFLLILAVVIIGVIIGRFGYGFISNIFTPEPVVIKPKKAAKAIVKQSLSNSEQELVCQVAIAVLMGRKIDIIYANMQSGGVIHTSYQRPSDGKRWENLCKLEGNRVIWASIENGSSGRWRNRAADVRVSFALTKEDITINQRYNNGSSISDTFKRPKK